MIDDREGREMVTRVCTSVKSCRNVKQSKSIIQDSGKIARIIFRNAKKNNRLRTQAGSAVKKVYSGMLGRGFRSRLDVSPRLKWR